MTRLGYGIVSYFSLIYTMMIIFGLITIFYIPVMMNNLSWDGYLGDVGAGFTLRTTLGNLGQSETRCATFKMVTDDLTVGCMTGKIVNISEFGLFARDSEADVKGLCSASSGVSTKMTCDSVSSRKHPLYTERLSSCVNKKSCLVHDLHKVLPLGSQPDQSSCVIEESTSLYIQYTCHEEEENLE